MKKQDILVAFVMDNIFNTTSQEEGVNLYKTMTELPDGSPQLESVTPREPFDHLDNDDLVILVTDRVTDLEYLVKQHNDAEA